MRLVRRAKGLRIIFLIAGKTLPQVLSLVLLLLLVLIAFALLFFYLFADVPLMYEGSFSRFDNALYSFLTCFQMVTLDDWPFIAQNLYNGYEAAPWAAVLLVVIVTVIGNYIVMQIVIAVILVTFDEVGQRELELDDLRSLSIRLLRRKRDALLQQRKVNHPRQSSSSPSKVYGSSSAAGSGKVVPMSSTDTANDSDSPQLVETAVDVDLTVKLSIHINDEILSILRASRQKSEKDVRRRVEAFARADQSQPTNQFDLQGTTCCGRLSAASPLRRRCFRATQSKWFDTTILTIVVLSCIAFALQTPSSRHVRVQCCVFCVRFAT